MRISDESREVVLVGGVLEDALRDGFAFGVVDGFVSVADDVENDIVVSGVEVMAVLEPVRRVNMDFDIANPVDGLACGLGGGLRVGLGGWLGIGLGVGLSVGLGIGLSGWLGDAEVDGREVRSCIGVVYTDGQHFEMPSVGGELRERTEDFPLPDVMEEYFRHLFFYGEVCGGCSGCAGGGVGCAGVWRAVTTA